MPLQGLPQPRIRVNPSAREEVQDSQPGFQDGLNTVSNDFALLPTQMRRSDNGRLSDIGAATKRGGTRRTASALAAAAVKGGYSWRQSSSTTYTMALCNGHLFTTTYGSFPLTWTDRSGAFSATVPSFAGFRDGSANVVYIATGGALRKWDATTLTSLPNPVQATGITVYHERLWGWGVSGALDSLYYSALNNGDTLGYGAGDGGLIIVRTFGQQDIVACAPVNTSLLIFHRRGISRLTGYGQADISVTPEAVTADVGLVGPQALCIYNNIAYFVSERGLYTANEMSVAPVATPEKPDVVLPQLLTLSSSDLALVKCTFNHATREVWVQLPGIGVYIYHTILQSWAGPFVDGYLSPDTTCLFESIDTNGQPVLLRGDASGYVSLCDAPNLFLDNIAADGTGGTTYNLVVQCHRFYCGDPTRANAYRWADILGALQGSVSASISWATLTDAGTSQIMAPTSPTSWGSATSTWGTGVWGAGGQNPLYCDLSGTGSFIDITIVDTGQAASQYASVQIEAYAYGRR